MSPEFQSARSGKLFLNGEGQRGRQNSLGIRFIACQKCGLGECVRDRQLEEVRAGLES